MSKPMSAAEYRANAEKTKSQRPTEIVTLKSGAVFELRRPDLLGYIQTGRVPQSLLNEGVKAWQAQGKVPVGAGESNPDVVESLIFMREIVHDCTVNPKFVEFAVNENEIGAADMLPEDFNEIFSWAMTNQGVAGLQGLQSFRKGRKRGATGNKSRRKKLQHDTVEAVEDGSLVS